MTTKKEPKDLLGKTLKVGDKVAYCPYGKGVKRLTVGEITSFDRGLVNVDGDAKRSCNVVLVEAS